jgi:hypothetical protein
MLLFLYLYLYIRYHTTQTYYYHTSDSIYVNDITSYRFAYTLVECILFTVTTIYYKTYIQHYTGPNATDKTNRVDTNFGTSRYVICYSRNYKVPFVLIIQHTS